jgi:hypothetical protein
MITCASAINSTAFASVSFFPLSAQYGVRRKTAQLLVIVSNGPPQS